MAEGRVTQTGMSEARRTVERLPAAVTVALRGVSHQTAGRIQAGARARLRRQTKGTGRTADAIAIRARDDKNEVLVESKSVSPAPVNLPIWLEFGTSKMAARPYMRPASEAERERHHLDTREAVERATRQVGL